MERKALNQIRVASPCSAEWSGMLGDDQVRHCGDCKLHVYNLSAMSLQQITDLLEKKEGRVCVRFYRRADGTVITDDCPTGLAAVRRKMALMATALTGLLATLGFGMFANRGAMARTLRASVLGHINVVRQLADWMAPQPSPAIMGGIRPMYQPPVEPQRATMGEPAFSCGTNQPGRAEMGDYMAPPAVQRQLETREIKMGKLKR